MISEIHKYTIFILSCMSNVLNATYSTVHIGKPENSEKFISLNKAYDMRVTTDRCGLGSIWKEIPLKVEKFPQKVEKGPILIETYLNL